MVEHLQALCDCLLSNRQGRDHFNAVHEIYEELRRLDSRDFEQAYRHHFLLVRGQFQHLCHPNEHETINGGMVDEALNALRAVLPYYLGEGAHLDTKPFTFLRDPDLIPIIKRDYRELWLSLYPSHSWKSTVVLAGSILEAILYDVLTHPRIETAANAFATGHPRYNRFGPIAGRNWTLEAVIDAALHLNILRREEGAVIHQTLRDYRNFIHPMKEIRARQEVGENEAGLAVNALNTVIDHLQRTFAP